ncbi:MAG: hypothetical protein MHMPM18_003920 [Marteilia pararefringens]
MWKAPNNGAVSVISELISFNGGVGGGKEFVVGVALHDLREVVVGSVCVRSLGKEEKIQTLSTWSRLYNPRMRILCNKGVK